MGWNSREALRNTVCEKYSLQNQRNATKIRREIARRRRGWNGWAGRAGASGATNLPHSPDPAM